MALNTLLVLATSIGLIDMLLKKVLSNLEHHYNLIGHDLCYLECNSYKNGNMKNISRVTPKRLTNLVVIFKTKLKEK